MTEKYVTLVSHEKIDYRKNALKCPRNASHLMKAMSDSFDALHFLIPNPSSNKAKFEILNKKERKARHSKKERQRFQKMGLEKVNKKKNILKCRGRYVISYFSRQSNLKTNKKNNDAVVVGRISA